MSNKVTPEPEAAGAEWKQSAQANSSATQLRLIAIILWVAAIAAELGLIFGELLAKNGQPFTNGRMAILIGGLVVIAILAIAGNLLWKKANRLDPAHKSDTVRFFIQNQLGAFITLLAFVPLVVLIFLDKDLGKGQKAVAGGIGVVLALVATTLGIDFNPPSVEQYTAERDSVIEHVGSDTVYWGPSSDVFHICDKVSDLSRARDAGTIESGSVADAHAAGMDRLTLKVDQEQKQCGFAGAAAPTLGN